MTAPKLALSDNAVTDITADVVVIGTVQQDGGGFTLARGAEAVDAVFDGSLVDVLASLGAGGKAEEVVKPPVPPPAR